jgi:predicted SAM-dependent methyltransferase
MIKLHLGCGKRDFGPEWFHIDGAEYPHVGSHDITRLNFPDNTVDLIYASHVIEYFDREEIFPLLAEWRRVLKPGGILRLAVPDFTAISLYYEAKGVLHNLLGLLYGKMEMNGGYIYHKTVYDYTELSDILLMSDFNNIHTYDWRTTEHTHHDDHSQAYLPHMDKEHGRLMSLNVECEKA